MLYAIGGSERRLVGHVKMSAKITLELCAYARCMGASGRARIEQRGDNRTAGAAVDQRAQDSGGVRCCAGA